MLVPEGSGPGHLRPDAALRTPSELFSRYRIFKTEIVPAVRRREFRTSSSVTSSAFHPALIDRRLYGFMRYISGLIYGEDGFYDGYVCIDDGMVIETGTGRPPGPSIRGTAVPGFVDCHTHIADAGLTVPDGISLEDLVAPPDGLKHKYLRDTPDNVIIGNMKEFRTSMRRYGTSIFADFREGGVRGCNLIRSSVTGPRAIVLGRPVSPDFDADEIVSILNISDGIGLPSISDMGLGYMEDVADLVHRKNKILALHVSERVQEDFDTVMSLEPSFVVHMTRASRKDMMKCADSDIPVVVCPKSNMFFGNIPPLREMIGNGLTISLGTDNAMLRNPDMVAEAKAAADILGRDMADRMTDILLNNGRKLLYEGIGMSIETGSEQDVVIFPSLGGDPMTDILECTERIVI